MDKVYIVRTLFEAVGVCYTRDEAGQFCVDFLKTEEDPYANMSYWERATRDMTQDEIEKYEITVRNGEDEYVDYIEVPVLHAVKK